MLSDESQRAAGQVQNKGTVANSMYMTPWRGCRPLIINWIKGSQRGRYRFRSGKPMQDRSESLISRKDSRWNLSAHVKDSRRRYRWKSNLCRYFNFLFLRTSPPSLPLHERRRLALFYLSVCFVSYLGKVVCILRLTYLGRRKKKKPDLN